MAAQQDLQSIVGNGGEATNPLLHRAMAHLHEGAIKEASDLFEVAAAKGDLEARFQLGLICAHQGRRRTAARLRAKTYFTEILEAVDRGADFAGLDRVCFALGSIYNEEEESRVKAIRVVRKGLGINPLSSLGHNSLGILLLNDNQILSALGEFKVAIQLDPDFRAPYTHLARLFFKHVKQGDLGHEYQLIAREFGEGAAQVLARLSFELVELGREQAYEGLYTKGHQLKNLMGIAGSRLRGLRRRVRGKEDLEGELANLALEHEHLYEEWVGYLNTMKPEQVRPGIVEPAGMVYKVAEAIRSQAGKVSLEVRVQEGVPRIEADEAMLREAITNLCLNALEAMEERVGTVILGVGFDHQRSMVFIEVEDDGPGIAAEQLKHIFDPGFTTKERGNGYGLSIARRLVQAHHGDLRAKSLKGHGTIFRLDLPLNFDDGILPEGLGDNYLKDLED